MNPDNPNLRTADEWSDRYDELRAENQRLRAALESIEWITGNLDGSKDTCEIDRKLVQEALEEKD